MKLFNVNQRDIKLFTGTHTNSTNHPETNQNDILSMAKKLTQATDLFLESLSQKYIHT